MVDDSNQKIYVVQICTAYWFVCCSQDLFFIVFLYNKRTDVVLTVDWVEDSWWAFEGKGSSQKCDSDALGVDEERMTITMMIHLDTSWMDWMDWMERLL